MLLERFLVAFYPIALLQSRVSAELPKEFRSQQKSILDTIA